MNHYEQLEVSEQASLEVIEAAWKALMRKFHTDGSKPDEERARAINLAHDILADPKTRRQYDLQIAQERAADRRQIRQRMQTNPIETMFDPGAAQVNFQGNAYPAAYPGSFMDMASEAALRFGIGAFQEMVNRDPNLQAFFFAMRRPR